MKIVDEGKVVHPGNYTFQSWLFELDVGCDLRIKFPPRFRIITGDGPYDTFKVEGQEGQSIKFTINEVRDFRPPQIGGDTGVRHDSCRPM